MPHDPAHIVISRHWVTSGATRYHYRVAGPPDAREIPLVLVHGLGVSSVYWERLQPLLARERCVYALDLPGFGHTTRPRAVLNTVALARALDDWMTALHLPLAHLLGHSLGGQVVAECARAHPNRVSRLILVGSTVGTRGARAPRQLLRLLGDAARESPSLLPHILRDYLRAGPRRVLGTDMTADDDDTVATIARLSLPLLVVRGSRDNVVPLTETRQALEAAPHALFIEVADAAHAVHWSRPEALAAVVEDFLAIPGERLRKRTHCAKE